MILYHLAIVGIGGFFGAIARFSISKSLNQLTFPKGTLAVNLLGAFLLGLFTGIQLNEMFLLLVGTGFLGAFTTFSTIQLEVINIKRKKNNKSAILYILITYGFGIALAYLGYLIGSSFY